MSGPDPAWGQTSFFPPEPAPDPLLCWLWLAGTLGVGSSHNGSVLDAFGGAQEAWEQRGSDAFRRAAGPGAAQRALLPTTRRSITAPLRGGVRPGISAS